MWVCSKNQWLRLAFFLGLFLILNPIEPNHWRPWRIPFIKLLATAQAHLDPPEVEVVCGGLGSVLLHQPFTGAQSPGQSVDLGRFTHSGHPCSWTFLCRGNIPATSHSMPAKIQPEHQPPPTHVCVLIATERKTGYRDQVGRTCSSRSPTCMGSTPTCCVWPYHLHWAFSTRYN